MTAAATIISPDQLGARVLLAVAAIAVTARLAGKTFERIGQPAVVGELTAGILLGPTVLGALPGDPTAWLLPPAARPALTSMGNLGLVLFMFLLGTELELGSLLRRKRVAASISLASVAVPFGLGLLLALVLSPPHGHRFLPFALFIGTAVSVTAFPVLARILTDARLRATPLGTLALSCAALEDAIAWTMLALALAAVGAHGLLGVPRMLGETAMFGAVLLVVVRPLLSRLLARSPRVTPGILSLAIAGAALSACATQMIGMHLVLGAFLFGLAFPRRGRLRTELEAKVSPMTRSVLLPLYFVTPGLAVNLRTIGIGGAEQAALILVVACAGKFAGTTGAARLLGMRWREATALGALMNTRGLMELIVLNLGLTAGILSARLYGLFLVMAITTTIMAGPILRMLYRGGRLPDDVIVGHRPRRGDAAWGRRAAAETP